MAFDFTRNIADASGKKTVNGTYSSNGGSTGGVIDTGLSRIETLSLTNSSATGSGEHSFVESLPKNGGEITIVTEADQIGVWSAIGF